MVCASYPPQSPPPQSGNSIPSNHEKICEKKPFSVSVPGDSIGATIEGSPIRSPDVPLTSLERSSNPDSLFSERRDSPTPTWDCNGIVVFSETLSSSSFSLMPICIYLLLKEPTSSTSSWIKNRALRDITAPNLDYQSTWLSGHIFCPAYRKPIQPL